MPKLKLRNAYLRGWFAARAERDLPDPDGMSEKPFIDRGYEAGVDSGGRALPLLDNPDPPSAPMPSVDIETVLQEYRARQQAMQRSPSGENPAEQSHAPGTADPEPAASSIMGANNGTGDSVETKAAEPPPVKPRKSRWDDDEDDVTDDTESKPEKFEPEKTNGSAAGRRRRYGK